MTPACHRPTADKRTIGAEPVSEGGASGVAACGGLTGCGFGGYGLGNSGFGASGSGTANLGMGAGWGG